MQQLKTLNSLAAIIFDVKAISSSTSISDFHLSKLTVLRMGQRR